MAANWTNKLAFKLLALFIAGAVGALSMPPFGYWTLIISLGVLWFYLSVSSTKKEAAAIGFVFGFAYFVASLWWVGNALLVGGNPYAWALPLAICGLPALLAIFTSLMALSTHLFFKGRHLGAYLGFIAMFSLWEWIRGHLLTGFPWNLTGMAWTYNLPLLQILSVGGIYVLSLITIFMFSTPTFAICGQGSKFTKTLMPILAIACGLSLYLWGQSRIDANPAAFDQSTIVNVITPNIPQADKWQSDKYWENYIKTVKAIGTPPNTPGLSGTSRLVVLPETAFHYAALQEDEPRSLLMTALKQFPERTYLLSGMLRRTETDGKANYYNSLVGFDSDLQELFTFDKFHLVPFGEYIPFEDYVPIGPVVGFSGFKSGPGPQTISLPDIAPFSPLVCYEVIFPGAVTHYAPTKKPRWIVNVTNDAWYGDSPGPHQHLGHAVYRAIEEGIPVIRSTNTGYSVIIDPVGRIISQSGLNEVSVLESYLPNALQTATAYSRKKDTLYVLLIGVLFVAGFALGRRPNPLDSK